MSQSLKTVRDRQHRKTLANVCKFILAAEAIATTVSAKRALRELRAALAPIDLGQLRRDLRRERG